MCGLVGMMGDIPHGGKAVFRDMLDVAQVRGRHSTGVIKVSQDNKHTWMKRVGPPAYLFDSMDYEKTIERGLVGVLAGHVRHKTVGEVNTKTAHPFEFEDAGITGMHNGTLKNYYNLDEHDNGNVDSQTLFQHLANHGPEKTFSTIEGAWACVWWDDNEKTINFIRNSERPLVFCWSKDKRVLFWASEEWMLGAVERRCDLFEGTDKIPKFIRMPTNTLWSFKIDAYAPKQSKTRRCITMRPTKKIEPFIPTPVKTTTTGVSSGSSGTKAGWTRQAAKTTVTVVENGDTSDTAKTTVKNLLDKCNNSHGGEVANPFPPGVKTLKEMDEEDAKKIATLLPMSQDKGVTPAEKTSTTISNVEFLHSSLNSSGSKMDLKKSKESQRNILSLRASSSLHSPKTNKNNVSESSDGLTGKSRPAGLSRYIDIRSVLGTDYITDRLSGREYTEQDFDKNTKGVCTFCDKPIGGLLHVHQFFDANTFMCTDCATNAPKSRLPNLSSKTE